MGEGFKSGAYQSHVELGIDFDWRDETVYDYSPESMDYVYKMDKELYDELVKAIQESKDYTEVEARIKEILPAYEDRAEAIAISEIAAQSLIGYRETISRSGLEGRYIFNTSDDELVCDECNSLDGTEYREGRLPHPKCRCYLTFEPYT